MKTSHKIGRKKKKIKTEEEIYQNIITEEVNARAIKMTKNHHHHQKRLTISSFDSFFSTYTHTRTIQYTVDSFSLSP
jgi:hypothetical protein